MRRIEKISARSDDMIILRGVNVFPTQIEEQILKCEGLAPHYVIELGRENRMDTMTILAEAVPHAADEPARLASARQLAHHVKSVVGVSAKVDVTEPGKLPRSEGKARRVLDRRPKD
jgi:phenylacetate-CoA ligase